MQRLRFRDLGRPSHRPHVATTRVAAGQVSLRHTHDFHEVFLIVSGTGTHHLNRRKDRLSAGDLVVIRPSDTHHFSCAVGEDLAILNTAVSSGWWSQFHRLMGGAISRDWFRRGHPPGCVRLSAAGLGEFRSVFEQLAGHDQRPPSDVIEAILRVVALFRPGREPAPSAPPAWLAAWRSALREAGEAVSEPLTAWQGRSGRSPEHLARSCRIFYGGTPTDLLNRARIERAKFLLGSTDEKVIAIALACGFGNLANFYRNFAKHTGMTPKAWRHRGSPTVPLAEVKGRRIS
jgi:AraC family cel operon transcriptional repressor